MNDPTTIRPKLRQNVVFFSTDEGMYFQRDQTIFHLRGVAAAQTFSRFAPLFTGEQTLEELGADLDTPHKAMLWKLVSTLLQKEILKNAYLEAPDLLPEHVYTYFRPHIEFIDHYSERPVQRFKTFRESRVLLVGSGEALSVLGCSLLRNGLRDLFLSPSDGLEVHKEHIEAEMTLLHQQEIEATITYVEPVLSTNPAELGKYQLIVYCSEQGTLQEILSFNRQCMKVQRMFLPACVFAGQAILGPLVRPPQGPCWLCALLRLTANMDAVQSAALWSTLALGTDQQSRAPLSFMGIPRRMGNDLGFEIFKILSDVLPAETADGLIIQDIETWESSREPVIAHPLCPLCSAVSLGEYQRMLAEVVAGTRDHELTPEEFFKHIETSRLISRRSGVFQGFVDDDLLQIPLKCTTLVGGSPLVSEPKPIEVVAFSLNHVNEARSSAFSKALNGYAHTVVNEKAILYACQDELEKQDVHPFPLQKLSLWSGATTPDRETRLAWLPAFSLFAQHSCYVPAAVVYPDSVFNAAGLSERTAAGAATGMTFQDVLTEGLLSALAYELQLAFTQGRAQALELDLTTLPGSDSDLTFLWQSAQQFGLPFTVLEVVHPAPFHMALICTKGLSVTTIQATGVGCSMTEALKKALIDAIGLWQLCQSDKRYVDLQKESLLNYYSTNDLASAPSCKSRLEEAPVTARHLQDYLRGCGRDMLFVNTLPPDLWDRSPVLCGTVLLTRPTT